MTDQPHTPPDQSDVQDTLNAPIPDPLTETHALIESDTDLNVASDLVASDLVASDSVADDSKLESTQVVDSLVEKSDDPTSAQGASRSSSSSRVQNVRFTEELLAECEYTIGYRFKNRRLLEQSLTHASISPTRLASNERLEFLGDSIMGAVVCEYLYIEFPEYPEGELTRIKSSVVSRHTCAQISAVLNFGKFLALGKGLAVHNEIPTSILAAAFESVIAGIYLDGGWDPTRHFIVNALRAEVQRVAHSSHGYNFKSMLQQSAQKTFGKTPIYKLLAEKGPDHSKTFHISAAIGERLFAPAWGASKKEAEQNAAQNALAELKIPSSS